MTPEQAAAQRAWEAFRSAVLRDAARMPAHGAYVRPATYPAGRHAAPVCVYPRGAADPSGPPPPPRGVESQGAGGA